MKIAPMLFLACLLPVFVLAASAEPAPDAAQIEFLHALEEGVIRGPLSEGLPEALPTDYLEREGFVPFALFREGPRAPLAVQVFFDDLPVKPRDMHKVFGEAFLARIPKDSGISESTDAHGRAVWSYPLNAAVVHFVTLKSRDASVSNIFELRIAQKVEQRRWAFGVYRPQGGELRLQNYPGFLEDRFTVLPAGGGKPIDVRLKHIPLGSCRDCHARTGAARYQYPTLEEVGPCEFTPPNPGVRADWAPAFERAHGFPPFEDQAPR